MPLILAGTDLSGVSGSNIRSDQLIFSNISNTARICIDHRDDTVPCEPDITGTVRLSGSTSVEIGEPRSAVVIVRDNDCR
jgi:hypothetical protein